MRVSVVEKLQSMKNVFYFLGVILLLTSCESLNEGINDNPNDITIDAIAAKSFLTGAQLGNIQVQVGHLQRISALWTRQLIGFQSSYLSLDRHNITTAESNGTWNRAYHGTLSQIRTIQEKAVSDDQLTAISKIIESHAIGTMASLFGDVPYSEASVEGIDAPKFDGQLAVFNQMQVVLDEVILLLEGVGNGLVIPEDIYFEGNVQKWVESAWTLKARYFLQVKDYTNAYTSAQNGISSPSNSMLFHPIGDTNTDNKNLFWQLAAGSRAGDIGNLKNGEASYLLRMMSDSSIISRNHGKTKEAARLTFYYINESDADANEGIAAATQSMPLITYVENQLILAEAGLRTQGFEVGLEHLNDLRAWLDSGNAFRQVDVNADLVYLSLDEDDFEGDGLENKDGIEPDRALLREILEERYVSGFGTWMPFNDARRLRDLEADVAVPFPVHPNGGDCFPQRFLYSANELDANSSAPVDPGLCSKTEANR